MSRTIAQILKTERKNLYACVEGFLKRSAAIPGDGTAAALARYARKIPAVFAAYAQDGDRKRLRRALGEASERAVEAQVPLALAERLLAVLRRFLRDLLCREFGEDSRALRRSLLLKDNFFEDAIGDYSRRLVRRERERIRETVKQHTAFFANTIFPAFLATGDGTLLHVNPAFLEHFGGGAETYRGKSVFEMLSLVGVSPAEIRNYRKQLRKNGFVRNMSMIGRCRKGQRAYLEISSVFTYSSRGKIVGFQGMIHNVTAHVLPQIKLQGAVKSLKRQGQTAKRANRTLKAVYESSPAGLLFVNPENQISMMNQKASEVFGFCMSDGESAVPLRPHFTAFAENLKRPGNLLSLLDRIEREPVLRADGVFEIREPSRFIQYQTLPVLDAKGSGLGRLWVLLDITRQVEDERIKEDLIHMIVHDLKSPLTALSGAAQVLRMQLREPPPVVLQTIEMINRNVSTMMSMVINLLDIHHFEAHGLKPDCRPLALEPLARETIDAMRGLLKERKIRLAFPRKRPLPRVMADSALIGRVLSNLFSNAIKHTRAETGEIRIAARSLPNGFVEVSVRDNGEGIPPHYHGRIFEKFQQVAGQKMKQATDTGLGLAFCKMAVSAHGGEIGLESAVNRGSRFFFTLPAEKLQTPERE